MTRKQLAMSAAIAVGVGLVSLLGHAAASSIWLSSLPAALALVIAFATRRAVFGLFVGAATGALLFSRGHLVRALVQFGSEYVIGTFRDPDRMLILGFTLCLGGMLQGVERGAAASDLGSVARKVLRATRAQLLTWLLGFVIFFDDYANSILLGTTMRRVFDRLQISREKLAFLVDSTAAPIASVAPISSWVGIELGYIAAQYKAAEHTVDPLSIFFLSMPYRFYPWLLLAFSLSGILMRREFGPMLRAEKQCQRIRQAPEAPETRSSNQAQAQFWLSLLPVASVVAFVVAHLAFQAWQLQAEAGGSFWRGFAKANSLVALFYAAVLGSLISIALTAKTVRGLEYGLKTWLAGVWGMRTPALILIGAWALSASVKDLQLARQLALVIGSTAQSGALPAVVFIVSAAVSFATGTSWGTMAIVFPIAVPLSQQLAGVQSAVTIATVGSILAGSVWGDHCSPISDTTIMSSAAAGCDHMRHVTTQLPYALSVGGIAATCTLAAGYGWLSPWLLLAAGGAASVAILALFGTRVTDRA